MEVYLVDSNMDKIGVLDIFISQIWTDRYYSPGDFEIVLPANDENRAKFRMGLYLQSSESDRTMLIETVEEYDADGGTDGDKDNLKLIKLTGRSVESICENRVTKESWTWKGTPAWLGVSLFRDSFIQYDPVRSYSSFDIIPNSFYTLRDNSGFEITYTPKYGQLDDAIREVCSFNDSSFYLQMDKFEGQPRLGYVAYEGRQTRVVFSEELSTLTGVKLIKSFSSYKNVALVRHSGGTIWQVARDPLYPDRPNMAIPRWFQRRLVYVDAMDLKRSDYEDQKIFEMILDARGRAALDEANYIHVVTGNVPDGTPAKYGEHYYMGDTVFVQNGLESTRARVTEYTWSTDSSGSSSYPTLSYI